MKQVNFLVFLTVIHIIAKIDIYKYENIIDTHAFFEILTISLHEPKLRSMYMCHVYIMVS